MKKLLSHSVCLLFLFLVLPWAAQAMEWQEIVGMLDAGYNAFEKDGTTVYKEKDTVTIEGGTVSDVYIGTMYDDAFNRVFGNDEEFIFKGVKIIDRRVLIGGDRNMPQQYRIVFDENTVVDTKQGLYIESEKDFTLEIVNDGKINASEGAAVYIIMYHDNLAAREKISITGNGTIATTGVRINDYDRLEMIEPVPAEPVEIFMPPYRFDAREEMIAAMKNKLERSLVLEYDMFAPPEGTYIAMANSVLYSEEEGAMYFFPEKIPVDAVPEIKLEDNQVVEMPSTGDNSNIHWAILMLACSCVALAKLKRREVRAKS